MDKKKLFPIRYVVRRTGLTAHVIRSWERRYGAVRPLRTETNRRLYSEEDIERLALLQRALVAGHAIGQIAELELTELKVLDPSMGDGKGRALAKTTSANVNPPEYYRRCIEAVTGFDMEALEHALNRAAVDLNRITLLDEVITPLVHSIGDLWAGGTLKIYQEHAASSVLRTFLGDLLRFSDVPATAAGLIVATPAGQFHELGAMIVAAAAAHEGWRVTYLGSHLPAEEIAGAAGRIRPKAVCLSLVYPADDPKLVFEIKRLRRSMPENIRLIVGGMAAGAYALHLEGAVEVVRSLSELFRTLK